MSSVRETITFSRQAAFKKCRRAHWYAYECGLRRVLDGKALRMGSAYHAGLEQLWTRGLEPGVEAVRGYYTQLDADQDDLAYEQETVVRLLCGYAWRWETSGIRMVVAEQSFQLPLINPVTQKPTRLFNLAGKIDGIVQLEDQRLAVMEHKLLSDSLDSDSDLWRRLQMDHQISLYVNAARRLGYDVAAVLYDVTRKPTIKPGAVPVLDENGQKIVVDPAGERVKTATGGWRQTGDTKLGYTVLQRDMTVDEWGDRLTDDIVARPEWYYQQREIARTDNQLAEFELELWDIQQSIRAAQKGNAWYRTVSVDTCPFCSYFEPCGNGYDPATGLVPEGFTFVNDVHPEL